MSQFKQTYSNDRIKEIVEYLDFWEEDERKRILRSRDELEVAQRERVEMDIKIEALRSAPASLRSPKEKLFQDFRSLNRQIKKLNKEIHESKLIIKQIEIYRERIAKCIE